MEDKKRRLCRIEWHDAYADSRWHDENDLKEFIKLGPCVCVNVGWIVYEDKDLILVASRTFKHAEEEKQWGQLEKIPKGWIRKRKILE